MNDYPLCLVALCSRNQITVWVLYLIRWRRRGNKLV